MNIKLLIPWKIVAIVGVASVLIIAAHLRSDTPLRKEIVDTAECTKKDPKTPAIRCAWKKGFPLECHCLTRMEYASLSYSWCTSKLPAGTIDPNCERGYKHDLIAPEKGIPRFAVNKRTTHMVDFAADSTRLEVAEDQK